MAKERGGEYSALSATSWWSKTSRLRTCWMELLAFHNFPHRKPTRFLVTFRVFCGWHRTHSKIDLSPALPEETYSLKMSLPLPSKTDITAWGIALPSQPGSCLRISFPPTWRLYFLLGEGREVPTVRKKKKKERKILHRIFGNNRSSEADWFQAKKSSFLPSEDQLNGTMHVKVLCNCKYQELSHTFACVPWIFKIQGAEGPNYLVIPLVTQIFQPQRPREPSWPGFSVGNSLYADRRWGWLQKLLWGWVHACYGGRGVGYVNESEGASISQQNWREGETGRLSVGGSPNWISATGLTRSLS